MFVDSIYKSNVKSEYFLNLQATHKRIILFLFLCNMQSFSQVFFKKIRFRRCNATCMKINLYTIAVIILGVSTLLSTIVICDQEIDDLSLNDYNDETYTFKSDMYVLNIIINKKKIYS